MEMENKPAQREKFKRRGKNQNAVAGELRGENKRKKSENILKKNNAKPLAEQNKQQNKQIKPVRERKPKVEKKQKPPKNAVKIVFLGGVGEIGKNMTALECGDDIIIIDAGIIFPTEETPGIDLVAPDITYLVENRKKLRALFLTHGHEDHIGGVPYLLKEVDVPVVGTKLTLALVDNKLREHRLNNVKERVIAPGDSYQAGCFKVEFVNVNHSIAGAVALCIHTPQGVIFHSGDFKIDLTPVAGKPIDLKSIADIGSNGVLLYMGESTNIERPGFTMSEAVVAETL
ncbi:MAG: ribonuclease J, partial [Clostridia bacterium]|nr:ribonuclease J [Clostridia bacterium]